MITVADGAGRDNEVSRRGRVRADSRLLTLALVVALTILGAGLRLYGLEAQSLWRDEAIALGFARQPTLDAVLTAIAAHDLHPPVWYVSLHLIVRLFGESEFALRLLPALAGILLIPAGYALGALLFNRRIGLLNAAFLCLSPFLLRYSQEARPYTILALLATLAMLALVAWLRRPTIARLLGFGLAAAAMLYTHNWGFFALAALDLYVLGLMVWDATKRPLFVPWVLANGLIVLLYLPWLPVFIQELGYNTAWMSTPDSSASLLVQTIEEWTAAGRASVLFVALAALGLSLGWTIERDPLRVRRTGTDHKVALVVMVGFVTLLIALGLSLNKPLYKPGRYTIVAYPAFSLLLAMGVAALRRRWLVALAAILLAALWLRKDAGLLADPYKSTARDVAAYVSAHIGEDDLLVFAPDPIGQSFNYYFDGDQFQVGYANWDAPQHWDIETWVAAWFEPDIQAATLATIDAHLDGGACLWLVYTPGPITIPGAEHAVEDFVRRLGETYPLREQVAYSELFETMQLNVYCPHAGLAGS